MYGKAQRTQNDKQVARFVALLNKLFGTDVAPFSIIAVFSPESSNTSLPALVTVFGIVIVAVSYTHLDVYKRQVRGNSVKAV